MLDYIELLLLVFSTTMNGGSITYASYIDPQLKDLKTTQTIKERLLQLFKQDLDLWTVKLEETQLDLLNHTNEITYPVIYDYTLFIESLQFILFLLLIIIILLLINIIVIVWKSKKSKF